MKSLSPRARTSLVMGVLIVLALVLEFIALGSNEGTAWTISRLTWALTSNPLFTFVAGMLAGHLFFPKTKCLLCGCLPYRVDEGIRALFDAKLLRAIAIYRAEDKTGNQPDLADVKRRAGFPAEGA